MPKIALENATIRALKSPARGSIDYWDTKLRGFGCRVSQGGAKTFVLKLRNSRHAIGRYPVLSLAEARVEAKRLLAERTLGKIRPRSVDYLHAVEVFLEEKAQARRARTVAGYRRMLQKHFAFRGQLSEITYEDFGRKLDRIKAPSERNHALAAARTFFTWAVKRRYLSENPTVSFSQTRRPFRTRVLADEELKRIWLASEQIGGEFGDIVKLLILTGQRRGEIAAIQRSWVSIRDKTITLPSEITKNRREHKFPIGSLGVQILGSNDGEWKTEAFRFPARGTNEQRCFSGWSKSKIELDRLSGILGWTLHDIRRTVATNLAALGIALPVIERLLNHVSGSFGGIVAVYQQHSFMVEMRDAVAKWEQRVSEICIR